MRRECLPHEPALKVSVNQIGVIERAEMPAEAGLAAQVLHQTTRLATRRLAPQLAGLGRGTRSGGDPFCQTEVLFHVISQRGRRRSREIFENIAEPLRPGFP